MTDDQADAVTREGEPSGGLSAEEIGAIRERQVKVLTEPDGYVWEHYSTEDPIADMLLVQDIPALLRHIDAITQHQRDQIERLAAVERQNVRLRDAMERIKRNYLSMGAGYGIPALVRDVDAALAAEARAAIVAEPEGRP